MKFDFSKYKKASSNVDWSKHDADLKEVHDYIMEFGSLHGKAQGVTKDIDAFAKLLQEQGVVDCSACAENKHVYKLGDKYRSDFDLEGMLQWALKLPYRKLSSLEKLAASFTDMNYHSEAKWLYEAIESLEKGNDAKAQEDLYNFQVAIWNELNDMNPDSNLPYPEKPKLDDPETELPNGTEVIVKNDVDKRVLTIKSSYWNTKDQRYYYKLSGFAGMEFEETDFDVIDDDATKGEPIGKHTIYPYKNGKIVVLGPKLEAFKTIDGWHFNPNMKIDGKKVQGFTFPEAQRGKVVELLNPEKFTAKPEPKAAAKKSAKPKKEKASKKAAQKPKKYIEAIRPEMEKLEKMDGNTPIDQLRDVAFKMQLKRKLWVQERDESQVNKKVLEFNYNNLIRWATNPGGYDIVGIDAPDSAKATVKARVIKDRLFGKYFGMFN